VQQASVNVFDQMFGSDLTKLYGLDDIDFGAGKDKPIDSIKFSEFDRI